jgi:ornithine cyclodeaminase
MLIASRQDILEVLPTLDLLPAMEAAFARYSAGEAVVPPVGELLLERGDVHIKYGYMRGDALYVVKIASGFYGNPDRGLPSSNGLMLLFRQETGEPVAALLDEGHLTDIRTAVAGAVAARHLKPDQVRRIGVVGTGIQARLQLRFLADVTPCRAVLVCGRTQEALDGYCRDETLGAFRLETTLDAADVLRTCDMVVTTTPATSPLLLADDLEPGTHITAVGADTPTKQELDVAILGAADLVVADSRTQCRERGEIHHALAAGVLAEDAVVELGDVIAGRESGRIADDHVTVADLTGVAVQDMTIASMVYEALINEVDEETT